MLSPVRWPLRWRLPAGICILLLAALTAFGFTAYWEVEKALIVVMQARLQTVSRQLTTLLTTSTQPRLVEARRLAASPTVRTALATATSTAARRDFEVFLKSSPQTLGLQLWSAAGERLVEVTQPTAVERSKAGPLLATRAPAAPGFSPIVAIGDQAYYDLAVPLPAAPGSGGYLVIRRQVSSAGAAGALSELLGGEMSLRIGSKDGVWTDLSKVTSDLPDVPAGADPSAATQYRDARGELLLGVRAPVQGTPWQLWVVIPQRAALAPVGVFLRRTLLLSLVVIAFGSLLASVLARRITAPLDELTAAAESVAAGDLSRRVAIARRDEMGRLGQAFNIMAARVEDGYDRLDTRVHERTAALEEAMTKLRETQEELVRREKLAMLGQLASGVGHELRNPLGVMTNAVYFLEMVQPDAPPDVREYHALLRAQIGLSEKIVSDLLDFGRIRPPRRESLALSRLIDDQLARVTVPDGIRIEREIPADLPLANVDPTQIGQVVLNLLVNALQAMESSGGVLTVRGAVQDGGIRLDVADSGPGVPAAIRDKIFEALFTTKARGIGLGLAVSRSLAEANGGQLSLASREGEGATFSLTMPAAGLAEAPDERHDHLQPTEAAIAIKEISPAVVLILCTGYPALLNETMAVLPSDWIYAGLTKPFAPTRLIELLDAVTRH